MEIHVRDRHISVVAVIVRAETFDEGASGICRENIRAPVVETYIWLPEMVRVRIFLEKGFVLSFGVEEKNVCWAVRIRCVVDAVKRRGSKRLVDRRHAQVTFEARGEENSALVAKNCVFEGALVAENRVEGEDHARIRWAQGRNARTCTDRQTCNCRSPSRRNRRWDRGDRPAHRGDRLARRGDRLARRVVLQVRQDHHEGIDSEVAHSFLHASWADPCHLVHRVLRNLPRFGQGNREIVSDADRVADLPEETAKRDL